MMGQGSGANLVSTKYNPIGFDNEDSGKLDYSENITVHYLRDNIICDIV